MTSDPNSDPEIRQHILGRSARFAQKVSRFDREVKPLLNELNSAGIDVNSLDDLIAARSPFESIENWRRRIKPVTPQAASILLKWLPVVSDDAVKGSIIHALNYAQEPSDGQPLVACFNADREERLRFDIVVAITRTNPTGIADWLVEIASKRRFGSDRGMLLLAVARHIPRETAVPILRQALDDLPGFAAVALAEVGGLEEAASLESHLNQPRAWERKAIEKAIRKIRKRAERETKKLANTKDRKRRK